MAECPQPSGGVAGPARRRGIAAGPRAAPRGLLAGWLACMLNHSETARFRGLERSTPRRRKAAQSCTRMRPCTPEPEPEPERGDPQAQPAQLTETRVGQYLTSTRSFVTPQSPASIEAEERRQERQASPHGKQQQRFAAANPALRNLGGAVLISVQEGLVPSLLCNSTSLHPY